MKIRMADAKVLLNPIIENRRIYQGLTNYFPNLNHYLVSILVLCQLQVTVSILGSFYFILLFS